MKRQMPAWKRNEIHDNVGQDGPSTHGPGPTLDRSGLGRIRIPDVSSHTADGGVPAT